MTWIRHLGGTLGLTGCTGLNAGNRHEMAETEITEYNPEVKPPNTVFFPRLYMCSCVCRTEN